MKESKENHNLDKTSKIKNCTFIGIDAGDDISEGENIIIIGDNIKNLDKKQKGVLFFGDRIAIGDYLFGKKLNLKDIILNQNK